MDNDPNCIFCKIAAKQIPAQIAYEDDEALAFHDLSPQAPVHLLVIPKRHIANVALAEESDAPLLGLLVRAAAHAARTLGITDSGFRVVANVGPDAGQSVDHLHLHVLGGRHLSWPPG